MKKLLITLMALLFIISVSYGQLRNKNIVDIQLATTAANKYDVDTMYVDITEFSGFPDIDSLLIVVSMDTTGGANETDSSQVSAVQIRQVPILRRPLQDLGIGMVVDDTTNNAVGNGTILEDSILTVGSANQYAFPVTTIQYMIIYEYNWNDTAAVRDDKPIITNINGFIYGK